MCRTRPRKSKKKCTFWISGTPVTRAEPRTSQELHFPEFWDSCAQNKTSEISKNALSRILRLLCAEQDAENLKTCTFRNSGTPVRRTRRRKSQQNALSRIMGLLLAEQHVGNANKTCMFKNSGTPVRRTNRRKSQRNTFYEFWDSCAQNNTLEI